MPARHNGYYPETVVFVLDACEDPGIEYAKHAARLELIKHCICHCVQAKSRVNASHKFGLAVIRDSVMWEGAGVTTSPERLLTALRGVQPHPCGGQQTPQLQQQQQPVVAAAAAAGPGVPRAPDLDLGDLVSLVQPLAVAEEADGCRVRVVLLYCRSTVMPLWTTRHRTGEALCMDVLFVHDKAAAAAAAASWPDCATPQDVYTWLEDRVDELSSRAGHHAYILEAGGHLVRKVTNHLISLVAHPAQRPPQRALRPAPLDLAAIPPQPTSATAAAAAAAGGLDSSAFPPLPAVTAPASAPAAGAWGLQAPGGGASVAPRSYSPPGLAAVLPPPPLAAASAGAAADLIDLTSPSFIEYRPLPPPPLAAPAPGPTPTQHQQHQQAFPAAVTTMTPLPLLPLGGLPFTAYMPPGVVVPAAAASTNFGAGAAASTAAQALAGLALTQPQPVAAAAVVVDALGTASGGIAAAGVAEVSAGSAGEPHAWLPALPQPPAGGPGPY